MPGPLCHLIKISLEKSHFGETYFAVGFLSYLWGRAEMFLSEEVLLFTSSASMASQMIREMTALHRPPHRRDRLGGPVTRRYSQHCARWATRWRT